MNQTAPYKIVVAEDEPPILNHLLRKLETLGLPLRVAGAAADGAEAKRLIERESPQIVITDIRMPEMDGLELCRWISETRPEIKTVVLSGYGEFEYAQAAIRYQVSSYLLKPINTIKLRDTLEKVCTELDRNLQQARRQSLIQSLSGGAEGKDLPCQFDGENFSLCLVCLGNLLDSGGEAEDFERYQALWLSGELDGFLAGEKLRYWWLIEEKNPNERMLLTVGTRPDLPRRLHNHLTRRLQGVCCVNLCAANQDVAFREIWNMARRMREALRRQLVPCRSGQFSLADETWPELSGTLWKSMAQAGRGRQSTQLRAMLHAYLEERRKKQVPQTALEETVREVLVTLSEQRREETAFFTEHYHACCREIACATESGALYAALEEHLAAAFAETAAEGVSAERLALSVKEYLEKHYQQEVVMESLAREFHFSESYIARLFRGRFGVPPVKYLLNLRMEKAKELIAANPDMSFGIVAETVGYGDQHYFSRLFRLSTGMSPSEYKDSLK